MPVIAKDPSNPCTRHTATKLSQKDFSRLIELSKRKKTSVSAQIRIAIISYLNLIDISIK